MHLCIHTIYIYNKQVYFALIATYQIANGDQYPTHNVSEVDLGKSEHFEGGTGLSDGWLDGFFEEFLHVHPKKRPGLFQHLNTQDKTEDVKANQFHTLIKYQSLNHFYFSIEGRLRPTKHNEVVMWLQHLSNYTHDTDFSL